MPGELPADVVLAFLDGEECMENYTLHDGLHGSRRLAATLLRNERTDKVLGVIVMDMIGDRDLQVTIPRNSDPELVSLVFRAAHREGLRDFFSLARGEIIDDHVPFRQAGMQAIDLIDFKFGSRPGLNDYWHTDQDNLDKISADSLEIVGRVVLRTADLLLAAEP